MKGDERRERIKGRGGDVKKDDEEMGGIEKGRGKDGGRENGREVDEEEGSGRNDDEKRRGKIIEITILHLIISYPSIHTLYNTQHTTHTKQGLRTFTLLALLTSSLILRTTAF